MADILFAFDPALDRPVPVPDAAPPEVVEAVSRAAAEAFDAAVEAARSASSIALVLCGRVLDPRRGSPAQAAHLRRQITTLAARGCSTVLMTDDPADPVELVRMLGEPAGLLRRRPSVRCASRRRPSRRRSAGGAGRCPRPSARRLPCRTPGRVP
ncbi:MAG: hypothetical protein ACKOOF_10885, partial [Planctomycetaceae bacterium]